VIKDYDRTLFRRLVFEGELAGDQLNAAPQHYLEKRDDAIRLAQAIRQRAGWDAPIADIAQWDEATLADLGLKRENVLRALEAEEHAREVRAGMEAAAPILNAKRQLALHLKKWVQDNFKSIA
jgi:hypothetical protein